MEREIAEAKAKSFKGYCPSIRRERMRRLPLACVRRGSRANSGGVARRDAAQTAMARTRGELSPSLAMAAGSSALSSELPIAMSTLRKNMSRPMRLIGEPENFARNAASSRRASSARVGRLRSSRACNWLRAPFAQTCSNGHTARQSSQP